MLTARLRLFGSAAWTYITASGPSERQMLNEWLHRWRESEGAPDFHLQEWDEEAEEWHDA